MRIWLAQSLFTLPSLLSTDAFVVTGSRERQRDVVRARIRQVSSSQEISEAETRRFDLVQD